MGCSLPGSSVHGIFQARVLEWVAISFSKSSLNRINFKKRKLGDPWETLGPCAQRGDSLKTQSEGGRAQVSERVLRGNQAWGTFSLQNWEELDLCCLSRSICGPS